MAAGAGSPARGCVRLGTGADGDRYGGGVACCSECGPHLHAYAATQHAYSNGVAYSDGCSDGYAHLYAFADCYS